MNLQKIIMLYLFFHFIICSYSQERCGIKMDCSDSIIVERYDNNYNKINIIKILPDSIISLCYIENDNEMYKGIISKEREEAIRLLVDDDKIDTSYYKCKYSLGFPYEFLNKVDKLISATNDLFINKRVPIVLRKAGFFDMPMVVPEGIFLIHKLKVKAYGNNTLIIQEQQDYGRILDKKFSDFHVRDHRYIFSNLFMDFINLLNSTILEIELKAGIL